MKQPAGNKELAHSPCTFPPKGSGSPFRSSPDSALESRAGVPCQRAAQGGVRAPAWSKAGCEGAGCPAVGTCTGPETGLVSSRRLIPATPLCPGLADQQAPVRQGDPRVPQDRAALLQTDPRHDAAQRAGDERAPGRGVAGAAGSRGALWAQGWELTSREGLWEAGGLCVTTPTPRAGL